MGGGCFDGFEISLKKNFSLSLKDFQGSCPHEPIQNTFHIFIEWITSRKEGLPILRLEKYTFGQPR